jgi:hypothetical protein
LVAMDGDGIVGDSIGTIDMPLTTTAGTTPAATRFITGTASTAAELHAAERVLAPMQGTGRLTETSADAAAE